MNLVCPRSELNETDSWSCECNEDLLPSYMPSFDKAKGIHYFHSELRPRLAGWPSERKDVVPANATHVALIKHRVAMKMFLFFPCRPSAHGEFSDDHIIGSCRALKLFEHNIARLGIYSASQADSGTLAQVDSPYLEV